ncbi:MAG TPA: biotin--[acetyl-CoA-carboxylase] ligase [Anaerolineales bacterium]|nr:biotin--[acetyl-CoA-carboxylase] ligase [Anaerolineales bacterium]
MDEYTLRQTLSDIPLGGLRFFARTASTNDIALQWASGSAPDLAMVFAEEQTAGRGRGGHSWFTPPGAALAFSLILKPLPGEEQAIARFSALGALSVCEALGALDLNPEIKWPNDVLLNRKKVCGVLPEAVWVGGRLESIVLGVGLNVHSGAVPPGKVAFPATSVENEAGQAGKSGATRPIDRFALLRQILQALMYWRGLVATEIFLHAWETRLAFFDEQVEIFNEGKPSVVGKIAGLEKDGSLRLKTGSGSVQTVQYGEVHLRPVV